MAYTTIDNPGLFFNTVLYTGNATDDRTVTGVGFQPDWSWLKDRTNANQHRIYDSVRGATKVIYSSLTTAQGTASTGLKSFDSDGFTLGTGSDENGNGANFASWNWLAGGASSSNSDGDVTSTVSANQTAGFSIATVSNLNSNSFGHGLGAEPELIINKRTDNTANWRVYFKGITSGKSLFLNTTAAETTESSRISSANSTTITVTGSGNGGTGGTGTAVYYSFKSIKGYSKFGSYTGGTDPFVYLGFKPAWIVFKNTNATENWRIVDNKRDDDNPVVQHLYPNTNGAEGSGASYSDFIDFLSNGFKIRSGSGEIDGSGNKIIYMAFAENPFVTEGTKAAGTAK